MVSITISIPDKMQSELKQFLWVSWSEIAREELLKRYIFEGFIKTGSISDAEWEFCEKIDWHPVDELPMKESFVKELEAARKASPGKAMTIVEFNKLCENL